MRVGGCPPLSEIRDLRSGLLRLDHRIHCDRSPTLDHDEGLGRSLLQSSSDARSVERLARDQSPLAIAELRMRWIDASLSSDHQSVYRLAEVLSELPMPERTRERIRLSEAVAVLAALQDGPILTPPLTPRESLDRLHKLALEAQGQQVRAQALEVIMRWDPAAHRRQRAHEMLWTELPQTPPAHRLEEIPTRADWFVRGQAAFKARDYQLTLGALQHYTPLSSEALTLLPRSIPSAIKPPVPPEDLSKQSREGWSQHLLNESIEAQRAALMIGISLMRLRVYPQEVERQLARAALGPDHQTRLSAVYYQAHLMSRMKRWDESLDHLRTYIASGPNGRRKREARYQIGRTLHQAGRYDEAIKAHQRFLATRPKDKPMYEWFLGWSYFRKGDCLSAKRIWKKLSNQGNLLVGPKALYWIARCEAKMNQRSRALRTLKTLLKQAPLGYYALLAQSFYARLKNRPFQWKNPLRRDRARHWRAAAHSLPKREIKKLKRHRETRQLGEQVSRALSLVSVGEEGLARVQTHRVCYGEHQKLMKRRLGKAKFYQLCDTLLFYTGDHGKRWKRQASRRIAWRSGISKRTPKERVGAYPLAYYDLSVAAADVEDVSPWWIMSHMLQESRYRPEVVSYAQAIGLMQILGRTGKRIHERLKWPRGPFFSDQLYDPALSIRYAAWYLRRLSDDLGHTMLAIGAYNGGPMRFADHQDEFQGQPFDVMVEEMGAHESRNYLRKVTDHFVRYLALYASDAEWTRWTRRLAPPQYTPKAKRTVGF